MVVSSVRTAVDEVAADDSLAVGFARAGQSVTTVNTIDDALAVTRLDDVVVVLERPGPDGNDRSLELVAALRRARVDHAVRPVIVMLGSEERRAAALSAGATAFLSNPAYVNDVVTLARVLGTPSADGWGRGFRGQLDGLQLNPVVRALTAARMTGVFSLVRHYRRGELRFFDGEVTSAQVGALHGQSAFLQLLLWPESDFDLRHESVIRRHQIPLTPTELLVAAERFLRDFGEVCEGISPASVYEQDLLKAAENVGKIPREANPVLRHLRWHARSRRCH